MCQTQNLNYITCINVAASTNYNTCTVFSGKDCMHFTMATVFFLFLIPNDKN